MRVLVGEWLRGYLLVRVSFKVQAQARRGRGRWVGWWGLKGRGTIGLQGMGRLLDSGYD